MDLFERMLLLMVVAIVLLQLSRRFDVPYPSLLAVAGCTAGALGAAPAIGIEPSLALALFIAPALLNSAYDIAPRELMRHGAALFALAVVAVVLTTAAVAWLGVTFGGLSWSAAVTLGAIVAPPDVVASAAVFRRYPLPRGTLTLLEGEGLLNDAIALLIFSTAVSLTLADPQQMGKPLYSLAWQFPAAR